MFSWISAQPHCHYCGLTSELAEGRAVCRNLQNLAHLQFPACPLSVLTFYGFIPAEQVQLSKGRESIILVNISRKFSLSQIEYGKHPPKQFFQTQYTWSSCKLWTNKLNGNIFLTEVFDENRQLLASQCRILITHIFDSTEISKLMMMLKQVFFWQIYRVEAFNFKWMTVPLWTEKYSDITLLHDRQKLQ